MNAGSDAPWSPKITTVGARVPNHSIQEEILRSVQRDVDAGMLDALMAISGRLTFCSECLWGGEWGDVRGSVGRVGLLGRKCPSCGELWSAVTPPFTVGTGGWLMVSVRKVRAGEGAA